MGPNFKQLFLSLALVLAGVSYGGERQGDSVSSAVFGASKLARNSLALNSEEQSAVSRAREAVLFEIRASGESFWEILTGGSPSSIDSANRERLLRQFSEAVILIWGIPGEAPCSRESPGACSLVRDYSDVHAFGFVLDPCFLPSRATARCKRDARFYEGELKETPTLLSAVRRALAHGAVRFFEEVRPRSAQKSIRDRLEVLLADSEAAIVRLTAACPGPYPKAFSLLLAQGKLLRPIDNPYVRSCGLKYLNVPYGRDGAWNRIPKACQEILDERRWMAWMAAKSAQPVRCGSVCAELLCLGPPTREVLAEYFDGADEGRPPRVIWFEKSPVLDLPENACDGSEPTRVEDFLRQTYLPFVVKPQFASKRDPLSARYDLPSTWIPCIREWTTKLPGNPSERGEPHSRKGFGGPAAEVLPAPSEEVTFDLD